MNVVLIDLSLSGHHLSFNRQFSKVLLENNCRVFLVVPNYYKVETWIKNIVPHLSTNLYCIEPLSSIGRLNSLLCSSTAKWIEYSITIRIIEKTFKTKIDFVFFSWFDSLLGSNLHPLVLDKLFKWKWSGLYFHPRFLRFQPKYLYKKLSWRDFDSAFLSRNCLAICIHDRSIKQPLELYRYRKNVLCFPETADISEANLNDPVTCQIRNLSEGRTVVGLIGCEPHKGLQFSLDLAIAADPKKYFFVFAGILPIHSLSSNLRRQWTAFADNPPANCLIHLGHIEEGVAYNSLFASIDIHLMFYENFTSSSNRLTKAAYLRRFVITDNDYCVGDDVRHFDLGAVVVSRNLEQVLASMESLRSRISNNDFPDELWKEYADINSLNELTKTFRELLALV